MLPTPIAAVIAIPPPAYADETRLTWAAGAGWAIPEGPHAALLARTGVLGGRLALGAAGFTLPTVTGTGRYFLPAPLTGGFLSAGATWPVGRPGDSALAHVEVGWQLRGPHWLLEVAAGPTPIPWGTGPVTWLPPGATGAPRLSATAYWRF